MEESEVFRPHWPKGLEQSKLYEVKCDDNGIERDATLKLMVDNQGDVYVSMHSYRKYSPSEVKKQLDPLPAVRIRTACGGGRNRRTRQALLWLAKAIELDTKSNSGED